MMTDRAALNPIAGAANDLAALYRSSAAFEIPEDTSQVQILGFVDTELTLIAVEGRELRGRILGSVKCYSVGEGSTTYVQLVANPPRTSLPGTPSVSEPISEQFFQPPHDVGSIKHMGPRRDAITEDVYQSNKQYGNRARCVDGR